ncbi:MAG TPA: HigA family addiction module antitoxin [Lamprocystis sp. (in: g-proteobacteria)]|nr:HigA family addiction module antitoxin [Lamprocystis sp. (in: g-proteobacteria)]
MTSTTRFEPDYVIPPGEILVEYLDSLGMTQRDLAARTGLTPKTVNEIVQGKAPITAETALKLERVLGRPAHFWQNLDSLYQAARVRGQEQAHLAGDLHWLKRLPVAEMAKLGWLPKVADPCTQLDLVLRFFGISSVTQWAVLWDGQGVAYRRSPRFETHPEAVSAWLRQGELEARGIPCAPFDKAGFRAVLDEARGLTREPPEVFQSKLVHLCASAGVAVTFVPELPKTGVSGATRWLTPDKALIQISLRYKSDDQLWFTFFHEAGHVLLHGKKEVFIEGDGGDEDKEHEANRFAADYLIPPVALRRLLAGGRPTLAQVATFADAVGISPGIVVDRLQKEKLYDYRVGNGLKRRFQWTGAD